ncbi:MAG TPA: DUF2092 domain-containing protein [Chthonomonadaceae bacterium]|nr:DUF2092 domain-containing protein [Chthonomonadaceae bacterium]
MIARHVIAAQRRLAGALSQNTRRPAKAFSKGLLALWIAVGLMGQGAWAASAEEQGAPSGTRPDFEPRALQLLQQMADTYAHLPALSQETVFTSSITPVTPPPPPGGKAPPAAPTGGNAASEAKGTAAALPATKTQEDPRRLRLLVQRPNRLLLELRQVDPTTRKPMITQWVSDGKTFWTYSEEKNAYTKEKAPGQLRDFLRLPNLNSGSLELLMILGLNPFADLQSKVDSARYEGEEEVRGVPTEVVALRIAAPGSVTETRLYIGKQDLLLRRLVTETTPILTYNTPGKIGDPLDELLDDAPLPAEPPTPKLPGPGGLPAADDSDTLSDSILPVKTRITYDNLIVAHPAFGPQEFAFAIPAGALLYQPFDPNKYPRAVARRDDLREIIKSLKSQRRSKAPKVVR